MLEFLIFFTIFFTIFVMVIVAAFIVVVKPGERLVIWNRLGFGKCSVRELGPGIHFVNSISWKTLDHGPFVKLVKNAPSHICPAPKSTVLLDPEKIEIMSSDAFSGTANVALDLQVLDWTASDIVGCNVPFYDQACVIVNQWVSRQLGSVTAAKLLNYSEVVSCLNSPENVKLLNEELKTCFLRANRISVDSGGIQLHHEYTSTVAREIQAKRQIGLQNLESEAAKQLTERQMQLKLLQTQADCENAKLRAETDVFVEKKKAEAMAARATALLSGGLTSHQVTNILISEISAAGVGKADKVFVGLPQGFLGLRAVSEQGPGQEYEKV